jgi:hypothetical protein
VPRPFTAKRARERIGSRPMRVRVSDPSLLSDLCNYLSQRGCAAVEASEDEANVLIPWRTEQLRGGDDAHGGDRPLASQAGRGRGHG